MKTTVETPDPLFRKAKAHAASKGQSFKQLITEALQSRLAKPSKPPEEAGWMKFFRSMKGHPAEMRRIDADIEAMFERIDPEAWE